MIDVGGSPQLSTFWRRRLTMLVPASRTSPALSRRNLRWLGAAAGLMLVLPTFHFAAAAAEATPAAENADSSAKMPVGKPSTAKGTPKPQPTPDTLNLAVDWVSSPQPSNEIFLPAYFYRDLCRREIRKELKLTGEQEQKVLDMARLWAKRSDEFEKDARKAAETLTREQRIANARELSKKMWQESKVVRKQIEELLTPTQLTELRSIALGQFGAGDLVFNARL